MNASDEAPSNKTVGRKPERAREGVHKPSPKNGIPPARTVAATDRKTNATPPAASRPTVSSSARNTPNGSLSKASSRPLSSTDGRRPQATTTASNGLTVGRKPRNSVSSINSAVGHLNDALSGKDEDAENKPPIPPERAGSTSPVKSILKTSSKPFPLVSSTATDSRPRSTVGHASKTASIRGADEGRARSVTNTVRNGRTGPSPTTAKPLSNGSISKGSSTVLASPSVNAISSKPTKTASSRQLSPLKKVRPGMVARKSTMSVTIEQRLREMSLVHQMLHAAMAEEGDEDDEVKEAYGVQMEETLAALKARLEEAKRGEGLVDSTAETDTKTSTDADRDHSLAADEGAATLSNDRIEAGPPQAENGDKDALRLAEREQILLEQLEGADISETDEITPRELKVAKLELLKVRSDFESLQASSEEEVSGLEETIESLTKRLHSIQASHQGKEREADSLERINEGLQEKIRELESSREKEISYYRERFGEQQNGQTQLMEAKDTEIRARQEAIQALEAKVDELQASKQCGEQYSRQIVEPLQDRMRQQHEFGERELSRHRAATEALETRIVQCEQALEGHKRENSALEHQLSEAQASKEREVNHLQEAIEALQDKIRQLNETKERELQDVKQSLAQEHEDAVSKLRLQLDNALVEKEADIKQQAASKEVGESSIQELRNTYQSQLEQLRATLASIHASNTELRHDLDNKKKGYEEEVSNLKTELERSAAEALDLRDEMKVARQQFSDLGEERNMAQSTIEADAEVLKQLSDNVASLQQQLTTSHNEEIALLEKNVQAEKELAMTKKLLEDLQEEKQRLSAAHELESKSARNLRADLERRCFNAQEAYNDLELEHATVQSQMDSLGADLARGSGKGNAAIERKLVKLCVEVEKAKEAKTELENQLEKAQAESEKHKTRIRELDSALKVTTAELVELRTERPNGSNYSGSPVSKAGLRSSRWAKEDHIGDGHRDDSLMAGMREHIRQMEDMNDDMIEEEQRVLDRIERITAKSPKSSPAIAYRHVRASPIARAQHAQHSTSGEAEDT